MLKVSPRFKVLTSLTALLVLASGVVGDVAVQKRNVDVVFDEYADALSSGNYQGAYSMCSPEFKSATNFEQFRAMHEGLTAQNGPLRRIVRMDSAVRWQMSSPNWIGRVEARLDFSNGEDRVLFEFRKSEGEWKLFGYEEH
jgi:hypothetical protein